MNIIETALKYYGHSRTHNHAWLEQIFKSGGHNFPTSSNWCAIFVDHVSRQCSKQRAVKPAVARSWLKVGVTPARPHIGDLVVFWRESPTSWKGHVGFYVGQDFDGKIFVLGGNQGPQRSVVIQRYPTDRLLGYRR